ncbi:MAG: phytanoyl-CoA dioxygenase family protein [Alphaproteobacteria bacterium]|nr:phytanoyl-CoA dioxygenase family protein [Alphaproteobacteria bacterium]
MLSTSSRPISEADVAAYERDGFFLMKRAFAPEWIDLMTRSVDEILDRPTERGANLSGEGMPGRFAYDNYLWVGHPGFRRLAFESPVGAIAARFMRARRVNLIYDFILVKEPYAKQETRWHQDIPTNPCEGRQTLGMWISLDHVTRDSGAVEWVRGSHKWGKRFVATTTGDPKRHKFLAGANGEPAADDADAVPVPDMAKERANYDIVSMETEPGDAIIASLWLLHGAPGNHTPRRRRAVGYRFVGEDSSYVVRTGARAIKTHTDPGLAHGAPFPDDPRHPVFPRIFPPGA